MNPLQRWLEASQSDEITAMNRLQEHGVISDHCVRAAGVESGDCLRAVAFLRGDAE